MKTFAGYDLEIVDKTWIDETPTLDTLIKNLRPEDQGPVSVFVSYLKRGNLAVEFEPNADPNYQTVDLIATGRKEEIDAVHTVLNEVFFLKTYFELGKFEQETYNYKVEAVITNIPLLDRNRKYDVQTTSGKTIINLGLKNYE